MADKKKLLYIVEESLYAENLEKGVSEMMEEGYIPHGSMVLGVNQRGEHMFYQPMVLKKDYRPLEIL